MNEAGEAAGVNNTFRQLGATLGNALIGSILIATLTTNLVDGINTSTKLPAALKPVISAGAGARAQSLGEGEVKGPKLPQPLVDELKLIQDTATAEAARTAIDYGVGVLAVGVLASLRLPGGMTGAGHVEPDVAATKPKPQPKLAKR